MDNDDGDHHNNNDDGKKALPDTGFIILVNLNIDNEELWAYLMVPTEKYDAFMEAQKQSICNIKEYGDIIEWGEGTEPPPHIVEKIENQFGTMFNHKDTLQNMDEAMKERLKRMNSNKE